MTSNWNHGEPFPPDPNAPQSPSARAPRRPIAADARDADRLTGEPARPRLIGPVAGAELCRIVYGRHAAPKFDPRWR
jgi:hypothetical protein